MWSESPLGQNNDSYKNNSITSSLNCRTTHFHSVWTLEETETAHSTICHIKMHSYQNTAGPQAADEDPMYQNLASPTPASISIPIQNDQTNTFTFSNVNLEEQQPSSKNNTLEAPTDPHDHRYTVLDQDRIQTLPSSSQQSKSNLDLTNNLKEGTPDPKKRLEDIEPIYLSHGLEDIPSWSSTLGLGFQVYLMMVATSVSLPIYIMSKMCMGDEDAARANLVSTFVFVSGIVTILQSSFGTRLPIVQGGSSAFMIPTLAILALDRWKCPEVLPEGAEARTELWQERMREIQGAIIIASFFQLLIGFSGMIGIILPFLTPITIASSVTMIGLSLFSIAGEPAGKNWWVAISTIVLIALFSQYLKNVHVPIPFTVSPKRDGPKRYQIFQRLPILLGMVVMWIICWFLTLLNWLPEGDPARTDRPQSVSILENSQWFTVPYPFQWGTPTITAGSVLGITAGVISGIVESIGDYYATAKIVGARAPPIHAINRGIFVEGIGCIIAGMWGTGNGTTSYSENIGAIGITQIGSRRVIQIGGLLMIVFSLICKLNAIFVIIPEPITGAFLIVIFGTLTAAGISNLKGVELGSPRNMFVVGFSIFFALTMSQWMGKHNGASLIKTGSESVDQMVSIFLSTGMFLGGFVAFVLDNTVPGTRKERGLEEWDKNFRKPKAEVEEGEEVDLDKKDDSYDLPFIMETLHKSTIAKWIPISPTFEQGNYVNFFMETLKFRKVWKGNKDGTE